MTLVLVVCGRSDPAQFEHPVWSNIRRRLPQRVRFCRRQIGKAMNLAGVHRPLVMVAVQGSPRPRQQRVLPSLQTRLSDSGNVGVHLFHQITNSQTPAGFAAALLCRCLSHPRHMPASWCGQRQRAPCRHGAPKRHRPHQQRYSPVNGRQPQFQHDSSTPSLNGNSRWW